METRSRPRVKTSFRIVSNLKPDSEAAIHLANGDNFEARAFDISVGGIGFIDKYYFPKGVMLALELDGAAFNISENIKVQGEITYCKSAGVHKYKCGIKFLDLKEKDKETIERFIKSHNQRKDYRLDLD